MKCLSTAVKFGMESPTKLHFSHPHMSTPCVQADEHHSMVYVHMLMLCCLSDSLAVAGRAGSVNHPVPPTPVATGPGGTREVVAMLVPFLQPTPQEIANNLLYLYIKYHLELGFSKFIQYTQV